MLGGWWLPPDRRRANIELLPEYFLVRDVEAGTLVVMPRPRSGDWLRDEIQGLADAGITAMVSLLEASEEYGLGLSQEQEVCTGLGIGFRSYPIPDRGVPNHMPSLIELLRHIRSDLRSGQTVAIHCRAGIGRSGLVAGCVLISLGVEPDDALSEISSARGIPVPDAEEQIDWLHDHAGKIRKEFRGF